MDTRTGTLIAFGFISALCSRGCEENAGGFKHNEEPAQDQSFSGEGCDVANGIVALTYPSKRGLRIDYQGAGTTYNIRGDSLVAPLDLKEWREFRVGNDRGALIILDQMTRTSLIVMYTVFAERERTIELSDANDVATAWVLRHAMADDENVVHAAWTAFLTEPSASTIAFKLEGQCKLTMRDGLVSEIVCKELQTFGTVPPDLLLLQRQKEWAKRDLVTAKEKLDKDPDSSIYKSSVEQARSRLEAICSMLDSPQLLPAKYLNVRCTLKLVREKTFFEIELM
ncbi:MAG: hypothetical protein IH624_18245 [Phycisphaerae bacterium]|nr:hypothetical protein [Phycisphaerae bacterium]